MTPDEKKAPKATRNAQTREAWRALGFFCDRDDSARLWRLVGDREGLARFASLVQAYVADPGHAKVSEHEHHGPYSSLELMTWSEPRLDDHAIAGRLENLLRLASLVTEALAAASPRDRIRLGEAYAPWSPFDLELEVRADGFDPASADPRCWP